MRGVCFASTNGHRRAAPPCPKSAKTGHCSVWEGSMQNLIRDRTIERNYLQKWRFLIPEYEAVKAGRSEAFRWVGDFYRHHGTCSQTFRKYYNRFLSSGEEADLLPQRRGPKWRERREPEGIEAEII